MLTIRIIAKGGKVYVQEKGKEKVCLEYKEKYRQGTYISIETDQVPCFLKIKLDSTMEESIVYVTGQEYVFPIPFLFDKIPYPKAAFDGKDHVICVETVNRDELNSVRNLCLNVYDWAGNKNCFPHAYANVVTRNSPMFLASNAINGNTQNHGHGPWPYESWGINKDLNAELTVEFGRPVTVNKVVLITRADFPHDSWWEQGCISFSDGSSEVVQMIKTDKPQVFEISSRDVEWVKLGKLIKTKTDKSEFPALTQIEVYGCEVPNRV